MLPEAGPEPEPEEDEAAALADPQTGAIPSEAFRQSLTRTITDEEQSLPHVEALAHELMRRYRNLNARKTN